MKIHVFIGIVRNNYRTILTAIYFVIHLVYAPGGQDGMYCLVFSSQIHDFFSHLREDIILQLTEGS